MRPNGRCGSATRGRRADRPGLKRSLGPSDIRGVTTIRTTCPQCGEVDMTPEAILLSIRDQSGEGSYRFSCPRCRDTVEKPADRKVAALLLSAGVELDESPPEEEDELGPDALELAE